MQHRIPKIERTFRIKAVHLNFIINVYRAIPMNSCNDQRGDNEDLPRLPIAITITVPRLRLFAPLQLQPPPSSKVLQDFHHCTPRRVPCRFALPLLSAPDRKNAAGLKLPLSDPCATPILVRTRYRIFAFGLDWSPLSLSFSATVF